MFLIHYCSGAIDSSSFEARRPAVCPRDPEILNNTQFYYSETDQTGFRGQAAERRDLNCQLPLGFSLLSISRRLSAESFIAG